MHLLSALLVTLVIPVFGLAAESPPVSLMPAVSEVAWGEAIPLGDGGVIVLSAQASAAEREAGRLFSTYLERRFGRGCPGVTPDKIPADASWRIYLGKPDSFPELNALCREQNLSVPEQPEGYALKVWANDKATLAVVAGRTGRSVIYGQDTLFQLLSRKSDQLTLQAATIRDWPTIPLRGRPHPHYQYYLKPENFDCMMSSRINFIDLRDGIYAFEVGAKLKKDDLRSITERAKARELRTYAVVNCGVKAEEHDAVINLFKEFIELGADGLWASFDDRGAGEAPEQLTARIIALGREHGITGDAIAITPPKGDYQTVDTPFNRKIVAVPGMEQAVWYWTSIPGQEDLTAGKAIGLKVKPSWWHNWPRVPHGSFRVGAEHPYMPVFSLGDGWNHPNERELRVMGDYVHSVMPWDGWQSQQHFLVPSIGWWSWRPEQYEFKALRRRMYDMVFGPQQVETAARFDDQLQALRSRFRFWSMQTEYAPHCPPRLNSLAERTAIERELLSLQKLLAGFDRAARSASLIEPETLDKQYLTPLAREFEAGLAATRAPYPEYWWPAHQDAVLRAVYAGNPAEADRLIAGARDRVLAEVSRVEQMFAGAKSLKEYVEWWNKRAGAKAADWQQLMDKRQAELRERIKDYSDTLAPTEQMLAGVTDPPIQVGTGVWERHNHLLAVAPPDPHETYWGDWIGGVHEYKGTKVAAFALAKHLATNGGVHSELPVNVPISGQRDRLGLLIYLADLNKESFGLGRAKWRWAGYRSVKLLWGDKELWKADLGIPRLSGEWFVVPLPELPADLKTLPLRLRVEDYFSMKNNLGIVYVGPLQLIEFDRD